MLALSRRYFLGGVAAATLPIPGFAALSAQSRSRIEGLIGAMTLEEKAGQLNIMPASADFAPATAANPAALPNTFENQAQQARDGKLTGVFNAPGLSWHRKMQQAAIESRLKIPMIFAADVIHGWRTVFPIPLAEAAAFDTDLAMRTARAAATEAGSDGVAWTFAPMVDIAHDARWGRIMEGAGEDVLLGRRLAEARVQGFQGRGLKHKDALASCAKHFAAYGAGEAGLDYNAADMSNAVLRGIYLPPFKAAFDAGAKTVMASFNSLNGVPSHGNPFLLRKVLRDEWGWDGLVVGDYTGDMEMIAHGFAKDERDAARIAILAGLDMSMASGFFGKYLPELVRSGDVPEARVNEAVQRVLALKEAVGLFDDPMGRLRGPYLGEKGPAFRPLAREAAVKSIVMLRNEDGILPITGKPKIALIGPTATLRGQQNGNWSVLGRDEDLTPMQDALGEAFGPGNVTAVRGSDIEAPLAGGIAQAVAAAGQADLVVLLVGEAERMSGEAQPRTEIVLPAPQQALVEAVAAVGKPYVVILKKGRPLALDGAVANAPALLVSWFLGTEHSRAVVDVLAGKAAPSARLPVSFPWRSGQEPYHYDHTTTGRPVDPAKPDTEYKARYRETLNEAQFPFGRGLTYGAVTYGPTRAAASTLMREGTLRITAELRNTGNRAAIETVQLYMHDKVASLVPPTRKLIDFKKIEVKPGQTATAEFTLTPDQLAFMGQDGEWVLEPGDFDIWIAPDAQAGMPVSISFA